MSETLTDESPEFVAHFKSGRSLPHPLSAYWASLDGKTGELGYQWSDKPHRHVFDLINEVVHLRSELLALRKRVGELEGAGWHEMNKVDDAGLALLPCPFCGAEGQLYKDGTDYPPREWMIECSACEASTAWGATEADAIAAWNRRAYQAKGGEVVAWQSRVWLSEQNKWGEWSLEDAPLAAQYPTLRIEDHPLYAHPKPDGIGVKGLEWSEVSPPNAYCSYHHTFADTPFGRYQIEWKGWKYHPSYTLMFRDSDFIPAADDLYLCKAAAVAHYETRIRRALTSPASGERDAPEGYVLVPVEPTAEMLRAGMDDLGWWVEPYEAPRESGVPIDSDMSAEDAAVINAQQIEVVASCYRAMLAAALRMEGK